MPACAEREDSMNNRPKGNHKHLDHSDRIVIERGLTNNESFRTIAAQVEKDQVLYRKKSDYIPIMWSVQRILLPQYPVFIITILLPPEQIYVK